jgi:hypothetical protein
MNRGLLHAQGRRDSGSTIQLVFCDRLPFPRPAEARGHGGIRGKIRGRARAGMNQHKKRRFLTLGEYILPDQGQNTEITGARREFIEMVRRVLPRFFEDLRERVYPKYARLVENQSDYWETGWTFETWQQHSDRDRELTPCLVAWAEKFHVAEETWILNGALETLWIWHRYPEERECLEIHGFHSYCCVETLSGGEEALFQFEHPGWDPQIQRWTSFRDSIEKRFQRQVQEYEQRLRSAVEAQGAVRARRRFRADHFEWFALYQLGSMSAVRILKGRLDLKGDESTILKGVKTAAGLLQWKSIRKIRRPTLPGFS